MGGVLYEEKPKSMIQLAKKNNYYFSYIRVSTRRQEDGGSLPAQTKAINNYAQKYNLEVVKFFKDAQSAGKGRERKNFKKMLKELKQTGDIAGIIMHKIDRGARNWRDWADLSDLMDKGYDIRFVSMGDIDVHSRGGRLTIDVQAAVAADYLRNLSEEVKKGLYERLENGIYPFGAPPGYLNAGPGKPKKNDLEQAALVKKCFDLYLTEEWNLKDLTRHMRGIGLKSSRGHPISINSLNKLLRNPFYMGIIKVRGKTFKGAHKPLITMAQFQKVQKILDDKRHKKVLSHYYIFKGMLKCGFCTSTLRSMFAKKKYRYYYCRDKNCEMKCIDEKEVERLLKEYFLELAFTQQETEMFKQSVKVSKTSLFQDNQKQISILNAKKQKLKHNQARLLDFFLEQKIEEEEYQEKKAEYTFKLKKIEEQIASSERSSEKTYKKIEQLGKLLKSPYLSYKKADSENKRRLVKSMVANLTLRPGKLVLEWKFPFDLVAKRTKFTSGGAGSDTWQTFSWIVREMYGFLQVRPFLSVPLLEVGVSRS